MKRDISDAANDEFNRYYPRSREMERPLNLVEPHLITRIQATQVHPVPESVQYPNGPFSQELLREPEIITVSPAYNEDGSDFELGATVQNNFNPPKYLRCSSCLARVLETETSTHVCEE